MLEDIVDATNGVYRPVFVSYNTKAKIAATGGKLAEKIFGEYLNQKAKIKGLPADPANPDSGSFSYLDTFSYSMGGIVARSFRNKSTVNMVHNMVMIAPPNHGTINLLNHLSKNNPFFLALINNLKWLNFGGTDMLDYDDVSAAGREQNPFLYDLNSPINSSAVSPLGDMTLFAGNNETGFGKFGPYLNALLDSPNDSLVPVASVYCRPSNSPPESKLSLLKVYGKGAKIAEVPPKNFSHDNIGKFLKRISEFSNEIALGLSDWTVERVYEDTDPDMKPDNFFKPPTATEWGFYKSKVKVEYNVWDGSEGRTARDYDRVVLVAYHKDGNGVWHISEPKGGENGADVHGNVNGAKVMVIQGNSKYTQVGNPLILNAVVNFEPTPGENEAGYKPEKYVADTTSLVIPLKPGKMTVPLDPTKAHFRTPNLNE
jgi:hypothetical protein